MPRGWRHQKLEAVIVPRINTKRAKPRTALSAGHARIAVGEAPRGVSCGAYAYPLASRQETELSWFPRAEAQLGRAADRDRARHTEDPVWAECQAARSA